LDATDFIAVSNNFLHGLFSKSNNILNGVPNTKASELYRYRSYLENLMIYGSDAANKHLDNTFYYIDSGDMVPCDPTTTYADTSNKGFFTRWNKIKQSK